jgi:hypothetical protein
LWLALRAGVFGCYLPAWEVGYPIWKTDREIRKWDSLIQSSAQLWNGALARTATLFPCHFGCRWQSSYSGSPSANGGGNAQPRAKRVPPRRTPAKAGDSARVGACQHRARNAVRGNWSGTGKEMRALDAGGNMRKRFAMVLLTGLTFHFSDRESTGNADKHKERGGTGNRTRE